MPVGATHPASRLMPRHFGHHPGGMLVRRSDVAAKRQALLAIECGPIPPHEALCRDHQLVALVHACVADTVTRDSRTSPHAVGLIRVTNGRGDVKAASRKKRMLFIALLDHIDEFGGVVGPAHKNGNTERTGASTASQRDRCDPLLAALVEPGDAPSLEKAPDPRPFRVRGQSMLSIVKAVVDVIGKIVLAMLAYSP
jgi:hypothetical protein